MNGGMWICITDAPKSWDHDTTFEVDPTAVLADLSADDLAAVRATNHPVRVVAVPAGEYTQVDRYSSGLYLALLPFVGRTPTPIPAPPAWTGAPQPPQTGWQPISQPISYKSKRGCATWIGYGVIAIVGLMVVVSIIGGNSDDDSPTYGQVEEFNDIVCDGKRAGYTLAQVEEMAGKNRGAVYEAWKDC